MSTRCWRVGPPPCSESPGCQRSRFGPWGPPVGSPGGAFPPRSCPTWSLSRWMAAGVYPLAPPAQVVGPEKWGPREQGLGSGRSPAGGGSCNLPQAAGCTWPLPCSRHGVPGPSGHGGGRPLRLLQPPDTGAVLLGCRGRPFCSLKEAGTLGFLCMGPKGSAGIRSSNSGD